MAADSGAPSADGAEQVLDPAALRELHEGGEDFFREIANLFCAEAPLQIERITQGLNSRDMQTVRHEAHSLKGSSLSMGARRISALCLQIEEAAKQNAACSALKLAADLSAEFQRVRAALELELKR